jgi:glycosyltransferase involved in cell wall biosynthesis
VRNPTLSVVLPVFNESAHLVQSIGVIEAALKSLDKSYEIIVVDDGSSDATWSALVSFARTNPCLSAVGLSRNFGKEAAIRAGLEAARGDAVIVMDADLQHPPALIPEMVNLWSTGECDVVDGRKEPVPRATWLHELGATGFYYWFQRVTGCDLNGSSDFKLLDRRVVDAYLQLPERRLFFRGLISWLGFRHTELMFRVAPRVEGLSKWSFGRLTRFAIDSLLSFSGAFVHIVTILGLGAISVAILLAIYTVALKCFGYASEGFSTIILVELFMGSSIMISLGILGEYVIRIYDELKQRPRYLAARQLHANAEHESPAVRRAA